MEEEKINLINSRVKQQWQRSNTNLCCFLCLTLTDFKAEEVEVVDNINNRAEKTLKETFQLKNICRFLKIDLGKLCQPSLLSVNNESSVVRPAGSIEYGYFEVDLCESCARVCNQISKLVLSLEKIHMEINHWLERIHHRISETSENLDLVENYSNRITAATTDPQSLAHLKLVDEIRLEIAKKSSKHNASLRRPQLELVRLEDDEECSEVLKRQENRRLTQTETHVEMDSTDDDGNVNFQDEEHFNFKFEPLLLSGTEEDPNEFSPSPTSSPPPSPSSSFPIPILMLSSDDLEESKPEPPPQLQTTNAHSTMEKETMFKKNSETGRFDCKLCPNSYKQDKSAMSHFRAVHLLIKNFKCHRCGTAFAAKTPMLLHLKLCDGNKKRAAVKVKNTYVFDTTSGNYFCSGCNQEFKTWSGAYKHYTRVHMKTRLRCDNCKVRYFNLERNLLSHQKTCGRMPKTSTSKSSAKKKKRAQKRLIKR